MVAEDGQVNAIDFEKRAFLSIRGFVKILRLDWKKNSAVFFRSWV
jgi:hypothetical protein